MKECSKSIPRRIKDSNFIRKYFTGNGLDIGGKPDPLSLYRELFPLVKSIQTWDLEDGDGQTLSTVGDNMFDFVHSSHCLEHLVDPTEAIANWLRVVREGGYVIVTVPDEDLYEQGYFPSIFNRDHKWTFTIYKETSWSSKSINLLEILKKLSKSSQIIKIEVINELYRYNFPLYDQTLTPIAESSIEFILQKNSAAESPNNGASPKRLGIISTDDTIHLNQYKDDMHNIKLGNVNNPPFTNNSPL